MKTVFYIAILFFLGTLVYNLSQYDYARDFTDKRNMPYIIGALAGVSGFLLSIIMVRYQDLKEKNQKNQ